jgi:methionine-rich copper-binding protein CopC
VAIKLDDTGETVYQSKGIKPGQYISYIRLAKKLDAGEYAATATFTAYTQDTHQVVGSTGAQLTLYVGSV